jgi:hypothetical protein
LLAGDAGIVISASAPTPKRGDVVVSRANDGSTRYALNRFGESPQVMCATREEAAVQAERFARTQHLDVWQTEDGRTFTRIFEARLASSV